MNTNINIIKRRLSLTLILATAILFSLSSFLLAPLYTYMCADIVYATTALPEIIEIIIDMIDVVSYAVCFATIIYSLFKFSLKGSVKLIIIYCIATLLKYLANLLLTWIADKAVSASDIPYILFYFILDVIILTVVTGISYTLIKKFYENHSLLEKANNTLGKRTESVHEEIFMNKKLFSLKNPLQASALITGIILSLAKILSRIRFDIYIGAPTSITDTIWMITYYVMDILIAFIIYFISLYLFAHFSSKE